MELFDIGVAERFYDNFFLHAPPGHQRRPPQDRTWVWGVLGLVVAEELPCLK